MTYEIRPRPFNPKAINGQSEEILVSHYESSYIGAIKRLNAIAAQLAELDYAKAPASMITGLKREGLITMNSMILHQAYFEGLGGGDTPHGALAAATARDFGSTDRWWTEFAAMGKAEGGGSDCVVLAYSPRDKRFINQWATRSYDDFGLWAAGARPRYVRACLSHGFRR